MITDDSLDNFLQVRVFLEEWWVAAKLLPTLHLTHATCYTPYARYFPTGAMSIHRGFLWLVQVCNLLLTFSLWLVQVCNLLLTFSLCAFILALFVVREVLSTHHSLLVTLEWYLEVGQTLLGNKFSL